ncbi:MAG: SpoIIE family protein phosphatase [Bacillota bacterium]|nr:SpoIIE family protein phosphatase [Bacillota bacterium]
MVYIDTSFKSLNKLGEELCGDRVEVVRTDNGVILVLSDGLGSGVKANILSTLTSKIISTMMREGASIEDTVDTIVHTLPVCSLRKVAYSTFSILHISSDGNGYLVEFDNPGCIFVRDGKQVNFEYITRTVAGKSIKEARFSVDIGDTLVLISDGVVYAGIGALLNLGWDWDNVAKYVTNESNTASTSARLTSLLSSACDELYQHKPGDDATVATVKIRPLQEVNLLTGPPLNREDDDKLVREFMESKGLKIICGGSSANMLCRVTGKNIETLLSSSNPDVPPIAHIKGVDLVTEGVLTLRKTVEIIRKYLDDPTEFESLEQIDENHGAAMIAKVLMEHCTSLNLFIGKAINPAHQNPNLPVDLSIKLRILEDLYNLMIRAGKKVKRTFY